MSAPKGNKNAVGNKGGRPRIFQNVDEFKVGALAYFTKCEEWKTLPTKSGLALHFGTHRQRLSDYEAQVEFSDAIKEVYTLIEDVWTQRLGSPQQVAGPIFYLKNAFHWHEKQEVDVTSKGDKITGINYIVPDGADGRTNV